MPATATGAAYNRPLGLARLVGVYALVGAMLAFSRPSPPYLAIGALLVVGGEALRVWAAGHLLKNEELVTSGPYRFTRNPLYVGRLLIFTGLCLATRLPHGLSWWLLPVGYAIFFGYYLPRKERVEPARLRAFHGEAFERYFRAVPALFPRMRPYADGDRRPWSFERALANREHWMVSGLAAVLAFLAWRAYSG